MIKSGPFEGLRRNGYGVLLVDPPWAFKTFVKDSIPQRAEDQHYPVMCFEDLVNLPVSELAAKDCAMMMWVIGSHLKQAIELGEHWGFKYKTDLFTWVKVGKNDPKVRPISLGYWSRKQTEQVLLFTKGSPKRLDAGVRQLIETGDHNIFTPKREHSRKPDEQYERIERLLGGPYLELFARQSSSGWDTWGNERKRFDPVVTLSPDLDDLLGEALPTESTKSNSDNFEDLLG